MTDAKLYCIAGFVTLFMFLFIIGAPLLARALEVGGRDQITHHYHTH
jgi:hypothetical protein